MRQSIEGFAEIQHKKPHSTRRVQEGKDLVHYESQRHCCTLAFSGDKSESLKEEELREILGLHYHATYGKDANQKNATARPIEIFMCSVVKRVGYADGF